MALGILGGVALMGLYFKPYPTVSKSVNEFYSSIFNDTSVSSFFLHYFSTQLDRCIVLIVCLSNNEGSSFLGISI